MAKLNVKDNKFMLITILGGVIVFGIVVFIILSSTATTKAVVFSEDVRAGTVITDTMVQEVAIPQNSSVGDYYKNKDTVIGEKVVTNVKKGQLVYQNNLMSSVDVAQRAENDQFITTSVQLPDSRALGGLLTAGDVVDVSVVPKGDKVKELASALPGFDVDQHIEGGIYFILSNVKILDSTTSVSSEQGSDLSSSVSEEVSSDEDSSFYLLSLSYADYKKLRLAEQFGDLYFSLVPSQNEKYAPMIAQMTETVNGGLSDSSSDPILENNPNVIYSNDKQNTSKKQETQKKDESSISSSSSEENKDDQTPSDESESSSSSSEGEQQD